MVKEINFSGSYCRGQFIYINLRKPRLFWCSQDIKERNEKELEHVFGELKHEQNNIPFTITDAL